MENNGSYLEKYKDKESFIAASQNKPIKTIYKKKDYSDAGENKPKKPNKK